METLALNDEDQKHMMVGKRSLPVTVTDSDDVKGVVVYDDDYKLDQWDQEVKYLKISIPLQLYKNTNPAYEILVLVDSIVVMLDGGKDAEAPFMVFFKGFAWNKHGLKMLELKVNKDVITFE